MDQLKTITSENLRKHRLAAGLTQAAVAGLIGIDPTAVSCIENRTRSLSHAEKTVLEFHLFGRVPQRIVEDAVA